MQIKTQFLPACIAHCAALENNSNLTIPLSFKPNQSQTDKKHNGPYWVMAYITISYLKN